VRIASLSILPLLATIASLSALALPASAAAPRPVSVSTAAYAAPVDDALSLALSSSAEVLSLDDAVAAAVVQRLTYLTTLQSEVTARGALKTQYGTYDPTLNLQFSNAAARNRTVVTPGVIPAPVDTRNPQFEGKLIQNLPTGGQLTYDVKDNGQQQIPFSTLHQAVATLSLAHPLLRGAGLGAAYAPVRAAFAALQSAQASSLRGLEQAIADAENAYWNLMSAEGQEEAARLSLIAADKLLERNRELEKRKLIAAYDVLTADAGAGQRRAAFIEAARTRRDARDALLFTVFGEETARRYKDGGYELRTATVAPNIPELPDEAVAEEKALDSREDLAAQRYGLRQADITLVQLRSNMLPDLSAVGSVGGTGNWQTGEQSAREEAVRRAMRWDDKIWSLGLSFNFPLFLRADRGKYLSGLAARETQRLAVVTSENQVRIDVRSATRAVVFETRRWQEAGRVADLYQRQLEGERRRLDLGLSDSYRLLQVEHDATQARLDLASAHLALSSALTNYRLAIGTISDAYRKSP